MDGSHLIPPELQALIDEEAQLVELLNRQRSYPIMVEESLMRMLDIISSFKSAAEQQRFLIRMDLQMGPGLASPAVLRRLLTTLLALSEHEDGKEPIVITPPHYVAFWHERYAALCLTYQLLPNAQILGHRLRADRLRHPFRHAIMKASIKALIITIESRYRTRRTRKQLLR